MASLNCYEDFSYHHVVVGLVSYEVFVCVLIIGVCGVLVCRPFRVR